MVVHPIMKVVMEVDRLLIHHEVVVVVDVAVVWAADQIIMVVAAEVVVTKMQMMNLVCLRKVIGISLHFNHRHRY